MNTVKIRIALLIILLFMLLPAATAITYRVEVDANYGFYRIRDIDTHTIPDFKNNTLTIKQGDVVEWENDATPDERLTIIGRSSDPTSSISLWDDTAARLRWNYQRFNYTFDTIGKYTISLREYPKKKMEVQVIGMALPGTEIPTTTQTYPNTSFQEEKTISQSTAEQTAAEHNNNFIVILGAMIAILLGIYLWCRSGKKREKP